MIKVKQVIKDRQNVKKTSREKERTIKQYTKFSMAPIFIIYLF